MPVSDARLIANRQNSLKSTGPKTPEGKARSRQNSLIHGLSGSGVVVAAEEDAAEVEIRASALHDEFRPKTPLGQILVRRIAFLSVRMERSAGQELASLAGRARSAIDDHDEARHDEADRLFDGLSEDPRRNLRKLRKSPEGIERLLDAYLEFLEDLNREPKPVWTASHLETAANLEGLRGTAARGSRVGALSRALWGDFDALTDSEGGDLDDLDRQAWAKDRLIDWIKDKMAELEAHFDTLDHDAFDLDRLEAPARSQFDPSREATLARRYEADASRCFFKSLKELRQAEAEALDHVAAAPPAPVVEPLASFRETSRPQPRDPMPTDPYPRPGHDRPLPNQEIRSKPLDAAGLKSDFRLEE